MDWEEYKYWMYKSLQDGRMDNYGCGCPFLTMVVFVALLLCGCTTTRSTESVTDYHRIERLSERMDSMLHATSVWQQSIFEKQTSLVDSFKHKEVRDTSHTVFLGAKGDTVRETMVIREYIEREHSSKESEKEYYQEIFKRTDSLLQVANSRIEKMDSTLHVQQKDTMVEKKPGFFARMKEYLFGAVFGIVCFFLVTLYFKHKK